MRMKKLIPLHRAYFLHGLLLLHATTPPPPKSIPDGAASSKDEMLAGVKVLAAYQEDMSTYLSCMEADAKKVLEKFARQKRKSLASTSKRKVFIKEYSAKYKTVPLRRGRVRWNCSTPKFVPLKRNQSDISVVRSLVTAPQNP